MGVHVTSGSGISMNDVNLQLSIAVIDTCG